jgi:hypothetical protein
MFRQINRPRRSDPLLLLLLLSLVANAQEESGTELEVPEDSRGLDRVCARIPDPVNRAGLENIR